ncbi:MULTISPECIES: low molecular weight protein-tyrosine-phosphatase [unclassified Vibrio]|uniref:protein-tyrosine-phosphatase n=1 Tax=Vibrio sp. HB236076 TaxID=3232307 RepID=A0AB39HD25_9VIBR|nr:low molecular weight protein-tyrosine-phosphatase [Vibrio sp. HB161653]MDP5253706.1 low molecular weight protein-tyrosine-phosphatase [Vibrio sp. HB161653]
MESHNLLKVLVVCMGNICRSPTAQAIIDKRCRDAGLAIEIDSAGTINYHRGQSPDRRAIQAAQSRGYDLNGLKARQVTRQDFDDFDLILAADLDNLADLKAMASREQRGKIHLLLAYAKLGERVIPDPYYGRNEGFDEVIDLLEQASDNLITLWSHAQPSGNKKAIE